jgi:hypothetical protein
MKYALWILIALVVAGGSAVIGYRTGFEAGAREAMLVDARLDAQHDMSLSRHVREGGTDEALIALDSKINTSVVEVELLTRVDSKEEQEARARLFKQLAEHRRKYPDTAGSVEPKAFSERVRRILGSH